MRSNDQERRAHWVKPNHASRMPHRWVTFDTEAYAARKGDTETQRWRLGAAVRWRDDRKTTDERESMLAHTPEELWTWITDWCRKGTRTIVWAHNLSYDVRISQLFTILPTLGFQLEWFNLSTTVSCISWRSDRGSLVFCDLFTWLPCALSDIGGMLGSGKLPMPPPGSSDDVWYTYCLQDAVIVEKAVRVLTAFVRDTDLGNWQPTGAGMAYAAWRHRFLDHKILVHDDGTALAAERAAMHTGRAEAWRHGTIGGATFVEHDMRMAYCRIAQECDLPIKLKYHDTACTLPLYQRLSQRFRVLARVRVRTTVPVLPSTTPRGILWPIGQFETTVWDVEIDAAIKSGAQVEILEMWRYTKGPVLARWADWVTELVHPLGIPAHPIVQTWAKHSSRALIGRLALKSPHWEEFGANPLQLTGISKITDAGTGRTQRLMHAGEVTLIEQDSAEADSSVPQITSWIMAECRVRLWEAMCAVGLEDLVHVDTDSLIVAQGRPGTATATVLADLPGDWQIKGAWQSMIIHGPRNYRAHKRRKAAGVPSKADETIPNVFTGQRWHSVSTSLTGGAADTVVIRDATWKIRHVDWKRGVAEHDDTRTVAVRVSLPGKEITRETEARGPY